jgi:hypothetical protein
VSSGISAASTGRRLAGLRVCLVTPGHPSTDPRLVKEADALVEEGASVTVVHGRFIAWADSVDLEFAQRAWQRIGVPFGPLAAPVDRLRQGVQHRLARLGERFGLPGAEGRERHAFHPVAEDLLQATRRVVADVYLAHNLAGLVAAGPVALARGALLGFDAEDDHVEELPDTTAAAPERARRDALLRQWLPHCEHLTAASPRIARALSARYGRAFEPVLNVFPCSDAAGLDGPATPDTDTLYWVSQTIGPGRGLEVVAQALGRLRSPASLVLRGRPVHGFVSALQSAAGPAARIGVEPPLPPGRVTASFAGHALALSTEIGDTQNRRDCLGNKIFHALLAGTPVLLSDTPAQRELAESLGPAALCLPIDDADALARRLDDWLADPAARRAAAGHAWGIARARYCWDVERARFLDTLSKSLWTRGGSLAAMG